MSGAFGRLYALIGTAAEASDFSYALLPDRPWQTDIRPLKIFILV